jgi:ubiquitin C-terminal hydrolase
MRCTTLSLQTSSTVIVSGECRCKTLQQALHNFASTDILDGDNKYRCPVTKRFVRAQRSTRIQEPPNVLTLHLKRFEFALCGKKVARHIAFGQDLDLSPYLHHTAPKANHWCALNVFRAAPIWTAALVLIGNSAFRGQPATTCCSSSTLNFQWAYIQGPAYGR